MTVTDPNNVTAGHSSRRARASRVKQPVKRAVATPVISVRPNPMAWEYAVSIAPDIRHLSVKPDGSVVVHNNPVR